MAPRNTRTGAVLENMVLPSLEQGGYTYRMQVHIGTRIGGGRHRVDVVASDDRGRNWLVSLKWQQVGGTAEQKVPFEAISLAKAISESEGTYEKAYLVLGGPGWRLRDFYVSGGLDQYLHYGNLVDIMSLEPFIAKANSGQL